jgi:hypothetical protein
VSELSAASLPRQDNADLCGGSRVMNFSVFSCPILNLSY